MANPQNYCHYCQRHIPFGYPCQHQSPHGHGAGGPNMAFGAGPLFDAGSGFHGPHMAARRAIRPPPPPQVVILPPPVRGTDTRPFVRGSFRGHPNGDGLRSALRNFLDTDWWFSNTRAPSGTLDQFVSEGARDMRCRFCQRQYPFQRGGPTRSQAARQALACVHNHINYHPR